ncbi:hypothetical protein [Flavobacterium sp.]|jgi:hypothetical protein|uniref:hypothetical protein n=1 Tax=Flavobacterium sp. TaxID=239 RepID=UPI0037C0C7F3
MNREYYHLPNSYGTEGVDHINISHLSDLYIGRVFEPSFRRVLRYPFVGKFISVTNLWVWLKSNPLDDGLRRLGSREVLSLFGNEKYRHSYVPNFKCIIAYATYLKIKADKVALGEIRKLPRNAVILSYYKPRGSDIRICSDFANVIVPAVNKIIAAIHDNKEPDFFEFQERGVGTGMNYLEPLLVSRLKGHVNVGRYVGKQNKRPNNNSLPLNLKHA